MVSRRRKDRRRAAARAALGILGLLLAAGGPVVCGGATGAAADAKSGGPETSELWGKAGEAWTPQSRLPDFSYAGYHCGDDPIPDVPVVANVRDLGAKGDGETDDTEAFLKAIREASNGAILIPQGRYKLTKILEIQKPRLVLRGEGPGKTVLFFPKPLREIGPASGWGPDRLKQVYYAYGALFVHGNEVCAPLADVKAPAKRGDTQLVVSRTEDISPGHLVRLIQRQQEGDLEGPLYHLYAGSKPADANASQWTNGEVVDWVVRVKAVKDDTLILDRPLRVDVRPQWKAQVLAYRPTVEEVGIEDLTIEFPRVKFIGPLQEPGYNAISLQRCLNCWVRNVHIIDAHNAIFCEEKARHCTIENVRISATSPGDERGITGLHATEADRCQDCLITKFSIETCFVFTLKLQLLANGNVFSKGIGVNINLDHHGEAPYENLFTDIEVGAGDRIWESGGRRESGARTTFWNVRISDSHKGRTVATLPKWPQCNLIAVWPAAWASQKPADKGSPAAWAEAIDPARLLTSA